MKTKAILAALLAITGSAHAQVMVETVAERGKRCEATMPALIEAGEAFAAQYEAGESDAIARLTVTDPSSVTLRQMKSRPVVAELRGIANACNVAAPAIGARADAAAGRITASSQRALDAAVKVALED